MTSQKICLASIHEVKKSTKILQNINGKNVVKCCWVERSLLWETTGSLAVVCNDLRVEN